MEPIRQMTSPKKAGISRTRTTTRRSACRRSVGRRSAGVDGEGWIFPDTARPIAGAMRQLSIKTAAWKKVNERRKVWADSLDAGPGGRRQAIVTTKTKAKKTTAVRSD